MTDQGTRSLPRLYLASRGSPATTSRFVRLPTYTPPITGLGAPFSGRPSGSRIEDEPTPVSPNGAFAGQSRPKPLLLDRPSGLLTPVYEAVFAPELLTPFNQLGLFALNICTSPGGPARHLAEHPHLWRRIARRDGLESRGERGRRMRRPDGANAPANAIFPTLQKIWRRRPC